MWMSRPWQTFAYVYKCSVSLSPGQDDSSQHHTQADVVRSALRPLSTTRKFVIVTGPTD